MADTTDEPGEFHGKWFAATNEEDFSLCEPFDNREDAIAWGEEEFTNLTDGDVFYTGQALWISNEMLLSNMPQRIVEMVNEYIYDNYGGDGDEFTASVAALADLYGLLMTWAEKHRVFSTRYTIEDVESHIIETCKETRVGDKDLPTKCIRPIEHDGEHEFL